MIREPKSSMTPEEIQRALDLLASGLSAARVAAMVGRHRRTIERLKTSGETIVQARGWQPMKRAPMSDATKVRMQAGRARCRLPHLTAEPWSPDWFRQQNEAFVAAMQRAHPELVERPSAMLLAAGRLTNSSPNQDRAPRDASARCGLDAAALGEIAGAADSEGGSERRGSMEAEVV
jgi:hypothetical protein